MAEIYDFEHDSSFRDTMTTSTAEGGRRWLYPEVVKGKWFWRRATVAYILLFSLVLGPFWEWNGHPLFLFDILHRNFIVFGVGFGPQDMNLLVLGMLTFAVFIFAFTQVFGRLWCGWACPQTIFMEWIFRPLESLIEGNANSRKKLDAAPSSSEKTTKKLAKYLLFWVLSFLIANVFLAYLIGKKELFNIVTDAPGQHWAGLLALILFTTVFFFVFTRLREIACILICPYGRLQSTLVDKNSLTVAYDVIRGEPRGHRKAGKMEENLGDCVDCNWCVKVCPTGIDIRNGSQMECIQCTACIDACDMVMQKVGKPENLVGYFTENQVLNKTPFKVRLKGYAYFGLWLILISILATLLFRRTPIESIVLRTPGNTGLVPEAGLVANLYNYELTNKTFVPQKISIVPENKEIEIEMVGNSSIEIQPQQIAKGSFFLKIPGADSISKKEKVKLLIFTNGEQSDVISTQFFFLPKITKP